MVPASSLGRGLTNESITTSRYRTTMKSLYTTRVVNYRSIVTVPISIQTRDPTCKGSSLCMIIVTQILSRLRMITTVAITFKIIGLWWQW